MDVAAFLGQHAPFEGLDPERLAAIVSSVLIEFFPAGSTILEKGEDPAEHLYVVRSGAVEITEDGVLLDVAGVGEVFGALSVISGASPTATARAQEDTLCYLIEAGAAAEALASGPGLSIIGRILQRLAERRGPALDGDLGRTRVHALIRRPPVTFPPEGSIAEAAATMAEHRISSLLVPSGGGWGILTDRDLRQRVLAAGRSPDVPVSEVMTFPAASIPADSMVSEALLGMLDGGFHHYPVIDRAGQLLGVVTDTDLLGLARQSPFALKSEIQRSPDRTTAIEAGRRLPAVAGELVDAGVDPVDVGHVVGATLDALTLRLVQLATDRLGEPPAPWAWFALGSQARHEQSLNTDQDHAIAYDATGHVPEELDGYFAGLAEAVTSGLEAAGIPRCKGDAMAVHPTLRRPVDAWVAQVVSWMRDPGIEGSILTSIAFDYRRVAGDLDVEARLDALVPGIARTHVGYLRHLAARVLDHRPPTGFVRDFVVERHGENAGRLDVKHGGIQILTSLGRLWALRGGRTEKRTLARLRAAVETDQLDEATRLALEEAFRLLWQIRLEHQAAQVRAGEPPDDFVDPSSIGPIARRGLKEAFRIIEREQKGVALEFGLG